MAGRGARVGDGGRKSPGVALFMRVEGQEEVPIGRARSMGDVPELVFLVAQHWESAMDDDDGGDLADE